jgi:hypothetical protein
MLFEYPNDFFPVKKSRLILFYLLFVFFIKGRFDIVGQSHQILHVAVVAAIYLHFYSISCLFHHVIQTEQCIMPIILKLGTTDLSVSSLNS